MSRVKIFLNKNVQERFPRINPRAITNTAYLKKNFVISNLSQQYGSNKNLCLMYKSLSPVVDLDHFLSVI